MDNNERHNYIVGATIHLNLNGFKTATEAREYAKKILGNLVDSLEFNPYVVKDGLVVYEPEIKK